MSTAEDRGVTSTDGSFAALMQRRLGSTHGSDMGRHARRAGLFFNAFPWAMISATLSWFVLMLRQQPCMQTDVSKPVNAFYSLCYSDISTLYQSKGLASGMSPFVLENPPLTNAFVGLMRSLSYMAGARQSADPQVLLHAANTFTIVNAVVLFFCFLMVVICCFQMTERRSQWAILMLATAPTVVMAGLVSWDIVGVALATFGALLWSRDKPLAAGILWGLGAAAAFHPLLFVVPLICVCLRANVQEELGYLLIGLALGFATPSALLNYLGPRYAGIYWASLTRSGADLGSIWFAMSQLGIHPQGLGVIQAMLVVLGVLLVAWIALFAPRRPRVAQLMFLSVACYQVVAKGYSPQHVLWLLPLLYLARPRWREWLIWSGAEVVYFCAVWGHLGGKMLPGGSSSDRIYIAAIVARVAVLIWLIGRVIADIYHPEDDALRAVVDDPVGGPLNDRDDVDWLVRLQDTVLGDRIVDEPVPATEPDVESAKEAVDA